MSYDEKPTTASFDEKPRYDEKNSSMGATEALGKDNNAPNVADVKVIKGSEAFNEALLKEPPSFNNGTTVILLACLLLGCFCQTVNGYDGSLFGGLTANKTFLNHFHGTNNGIWAGLVSAMYQIGSVCAIPFIGPGIDTWGRKVGMFIGAFLIVMGTIITGTTIHNPNVHQFMGGRFLLGFGISFVSSAGPIYVVETSHPAWRGIATAYCNCFWFTGSILASGAVRGGLDLAGNISWQLPVWLQMFFPGLIILFVWFIPESPRWLYVHNKREQAVASLTKWHGLGNPDSIWVKLQLQEYEEFLNMNGTDKTVWDYRALFNTRASCYRLACNCGFAIFAQWAGNGVLSYFLPAVLTTAGYTDSITQANVNLGYACFQFVFALFGAAWVDRLGRRPLMLCSMAGCCVVWVGMTAATGTYAHDSNPSAAKATLAMIFIFGAVFSIGLTPLQALYPVEVLSFEMRAKGMAFSNLAVSAGGLLNQFAWPVSLKAIGWKTYIVFVVWDAIQFFIFYFFLPETKGRTLEELDLVFQARNPVKASLQRHKVALDNQGTVLAKEEL